MCGEVNEAVFRISRSEILRLSQGDFDEVQDAFRSTGQALSVLAYAGLVRITRTYDVQTGDIAIKIRPTFRHAEIPLLSLETVILAEIRRNMLDRS